MSSSRHREAQRLVDKAQEEIDTRFPPPVESINRKMRFQYWRLFWATEGFTRLPGKDILDIGCGARPRPQREGAPLEHSGPGRMYEPWFSRFAAAAGAHVIGIDRRPSADENYTHVQGNILDPEILDRFDDKTFDIVNSSAFLVAPYRQKLDALGLNVTAPEILDQLDEKQLTILDERITEQVTRLLRDGGYFFYNESIYRKDEAGVLHSVPRATLVAQEGFPVMPSRDSTE